MLTPVTTKLDVLEISEIMKPWKSNRDRKEAGAPDRGTLSAKIIAIAAPWIELLGSDPPLPAMEFAYQTCMMAWNVSRVEDSTERGEIVRQLREGVVASAPKGAGSEVGQLFDLIFERARAAWPEDRRIGVNLAVVDLGDGSVRVDVASMAGEAEA